MLPAFAVRRPALVSETVALLDEDSVAYSGGTELLLVMRMGLLRPTALVDLKGVAELRNIAVEGSALVIGAGVTHDRIASDPLVGEHAPLLAAAERTVGNARVRAQGSIGGNICFAEPRSDVGTILIALDASLTLVSTGQTRTVRASEFLLGPYWTAREPEELLVSISIPLPAPNGVYLKFQTVERPTVAVAATRRGSTGCQLVVGAVGELPVHACYDDAGAVDVAELVGQVEPVADLTGSERYKRHVTEVYVRRALQALSGGEHD